MKPASPVLFQYCLIALVTLGYFLTPSLAQASLSLVTQPQPYQVFQRNDNNSGNIVISGTYSGVVPAIEARWTGSSWTTIDSAPTNGHFTGTLAGAAGQGPLEIRSTNQPELLLTVPYVGIGDILVIAGQSNAVSFGDEKQSYSHPTLKASLFGNDDVWKEFVDHPDDPTNQADQVSLDNYALKGSAWAVFATTYMADQNVPIAFIPTAKSGSLIQMWARDTSPATLYGSFLRRVKATGGKARFILWLQGESNASIQPQIQAQYTDLLNTLVNNFAADIPKVKVVIGQIGDNLRDPTNIPGDAVEAIRAAQRNVGNTNPNALPGPTLYDLPLGTDNIHFRSTPAITAVGQRFAATTLAGAYGADKDGKGPVFNKATFTGKKLTLNFRDQSLPLVVPANAGGFIITSSTGQSIGVETITLIAPDTLSVNLTQTIPTSSTLTISYGLGHWPTGKQAITDSSRAHLPIMPTQNYLATYSPDLPTFNPADFNQDTKVNISDYNLFLTDFGRTGSPGFKRTDINKDGKVNISDYNVLVQNFGAQ